MGQADLVFVVVFDHSGASLSRGCYGVDRFGVSGLAVADDVRGRVLEANRRAWGL